MCACMIEALKKVYNAEALRQRAARRRLPLRQSAFAAQYCSWFWFDCRSATAPGQAPRADESLHRRGDRSDLSAAPGLRDPCARRQSRGARRHRGRGRRDQQHPEAAGRPLVGSDRAGASRSCSPATRSPGSCGRSSRWPRPGSTCSSCACRDRVGKGLRGAPRDAMLGALAPDGQRGRVFGFHRAMDHCGAVIGPLMAAAFLWCLSRANTGRCSR